MPRLFENPDPDRHCPPCGQLAAIWRGAVDGTCRTVWNVASGCWNFAPAPACVLPCWSTARWILRGGTTRAESIGWHGPSGLRHPGLHEHDGEGGFSWARSFTGFLVTCGLDHILGPETVPADKLQLSRHPQQQPRSARPRIHHPRQLTGYGERWDGDRCILWAEGLVPSGHHLWRTPDLVPPDRGGSGRQ